ncbi:MAG: hypothetical protein DRQ03_07870 [Candidatus Hydrothermota bacterium]|nr:MAG: hypothetical protein DRQ03_07870 [Candidatus Hydrothermae bacterium]
MGTITLSVPDELKRRMSRVDWINWSSVARRAFSELLEDVEELEMRRTVLEIGGIPEDDTRDVRKSLVKEVIKSTDKVVEELRSGKRKPMTLNEFNKWCDEL